ncbi:serine hydrolase [Actinomadura barringtoniae]|uniref:Serine hydrolase n=1 Tax=Actinomadura barringtoniae TaxID=1427535 RepID=A0A939PNN3_9ACTN|nr:serine hydrolase [Actinomadura barringtoniae]MBO2455570.1 serine hydrolase [Actinomadura barringtoniae]
MPRGIRKSFSAALLAGTVLTSSLAIAPAASAAPRTTPTGAGAAAAAAANPCTSSAHPKMARTLGNAIRSALRGRTGTESVAVYDRKRHIYCAVDSSRHYDSASVVKATILGALLRKVLDQKRKMTSTEKSLAYKMITRSDNDAASSLWRSVGRTRMQRFLKQAGMSQTKLGPTHYWGLTQITARDQIRLLNVYTARNRILSDKARNYGLGLMGKVISSQRWGTPTGRPSGVHWHVKNGWLPRHGRYWRVHSIGTFDGRGQDYEIVVLTRDTPSMAYGIRTIERVARAVHNNLNPGMRSAYIESIPDSTWETSDGSVPADR